MKQFRDYQYNYNQMVLIRIIQTKTIHKVLYFKLNGFLRLNKGQDKSRQIKEKKGKVVSFLFLIFLCNMLVQIRETKISTCVVRNSLTKVLKHRKSA